MSLKFCNILVVREAQLGKSEWFSEIVMNHTELWNAKRAWYSLIVTRNPRFLANLTLPDRRGSCNPIEISRTIWLLNCNQLWFHLLYNKYFCHLGSVYAPVWTRKAELPELLRGMSICAAFKSHGKKQCINVSVYRQVEYSQPQWVTLPRLELLR